MYQAPKFDGINILSIEHMDNGITALSTPCKDYDEFALLPQLVSWAGKVYGKKGWNSDHYVAYYRDDIEYAEKV